MVRKNPLIERGPTPQGGRPKVQAKATDLPTSLFTLRPMEEYEKLWDAITSDLAADIARIKAYMQIGLPGIDEDYLEDLADQLNKLLEQPDDISY